MRMSFYESFILAVVEGLTEYLPISSTGHLILTSSLMGIQENDFVKNYTVIVQFGAVLSVVVFYWHRFVVSLDLYKKLFVAFLPAAVVGLAVKNYIDGILGDVHVVAWSLILGGIFLIITDKYFLEHEHKGSVETLTLKEALIIGFCQCVAFIPGVSRSGATLLGGLTQNLTRKSAAEFSFLLAVPTLTAATAHKTLRVAAHLESNQLLILIFGNAVSFLIGILTIRTFIGYLTRHGLWMFGVYRILIGSFILILLAAGYSMHVM